MGKKENFKIGRFLHLKSRNPKSQIDGVPLSVQVVQFAIGFRDFRCRTRPISKFRLNASSRRALRLRFRAPAEG